MVSRADNEGQSIRFLAAAKPSRTFIGCGDGLSVCRPFVLRPVCPVCATRCIKQSVQIYTQNCALTNKYCIGIKPVTDNSIHME